jgi:hypothetical protein
VEGKRFQHVEGIKEIVTAELNTVPLESFDDLFSKTVIQINNC